MAGNHSFLEFLIWELFQQFQAWLVLDDSIISSFKTSGSFCSLSIYPFRHFKHFWWLVDRGPWPLRGRLTLYLSLLQEIRSFNASCTSFAPLMPKFWDSGHSSNSWLSLRMTWLTRLMLICESSWNHFIGPDNTHPRQKTRDLEGIRPFWFQCVDFQFPLWWGSCNPLSDSIPSCRRNMSSSYTVPNPESFV